MKYSVFLPNILRFSILFLLFFFGINSNFAQGWSEKLRAADKLFEEGKYAEAGEQYEKAWRLKTDRRDLIFKAGECFFWAKDYRKAADCYQIVRTENKEFEIVGLKYARAVKQDGRYYEAKEAFQRFSSEYSGPGKKILDKILATDIQGCEMALESKRTRAAEKVNMEFELLPTVVNTQANEFAPVAYSDDLLYFSSNHTGVARIYRTRREDGQWTAPVEATGIPMPAGNHIGNGCFSPDGARFYFTECSGIEQGSSENRSGLRARCAILFTSRQSDGAWSEPKKLPSYINFSAATATHPFVYEENGHEILLFVSDRTGGFGGLDVYSTSRALDSGELDFSLPQNLGDQINTGGDEITPFYDQEQQKLYFSSNGLPSHGGMDIFSAQKKSDLWLPPTNIGVPFNSSADDSFFALKKSGQGGFFVSNRLVGTTKTSSRHDDLFEFLPKITERPKLQVTVVDSESKKPLEASVKLFERMPNGKKRFLTLGNSTKEGIISLPVLATAQYEVEVSAQGYVPQQESAKITSEKMYVADVFLRKNPVNNSNPAPVAHSMASKGLSNTTTVSGSHFKIQLEAVSDFLPNSSVYIAAKNYGELSAEFIPERNLNRIMLGTFTDKTEANEVAKMLRTQGAFPQAFVVKYQGNTRF